MVLGSDNDFQDQALGRDILDIEDDTISTSQVCLSLTLNKLISKDYLLLLVLL